MKAVFALLLLLCYLPLFAQDERALAKKYELTGDSLAKISNYSQAILQRKKALNIFQNLRPVPFEDVARSFRSIGIYYRRWGKFPEAAVNLKRSVEIASQRLDTFHPELAKAYNSLGNYYLQQGEHEKALDFLHKALKINQTKKYPGVADNFNNIGIVYENQGKDELAAANYRKALDENLRTVGRWNIGTANNYNNLGSLNYDLGEFDLALANFDSVLVVYDSLLPENSADFAGIYNNIGAIHNIKGDDRQALAFFNKALHLNQTTLGSDHPEVADNYANMGILLLERGDLDKSLTYFQKAYAIRTNHFGKDHPLVARSANYLGNCYLEKNDFDRAFEWLERSLFIRLKNTGDDPGAVADSRNDLGLAFEKIGNYEEALQQYEAALKINEKKKDGKSTDVANSYDRIGDVLLAKKKYAAASTFFYKALHVRQKLFGNRHPDVADLYRKLALTCPQDTVCAFEHLDSALAAIRFDPAAGGDFGKTISPLTLLEIFQTKGILLHGIFDAGGNLSYLKAADQTYRKGMELIDFIKITFEEAGSRRALLDRFFQLYEDAIAVKCQLKIATGQANYWQEAFEISERSNATLLLEAMQTVEAERFANIPDSLLQRERRLKIDLAFLEKLRYEEEWKGDSADLRKLNELQGKIFRLKTEQSKLMEKFRERFPDYFEKKYAPGIVQVAEIQRNLLNEGQTMLAYFVGEQRIFAFVISKNAYDVVEISKDFPLEAWVEEFRNSIYRFNPAKKNIEYLSQKYANIGHELWQLIFEPVLPYLKTDKLVIVPGGVLGYLPFEALLAKQPTHYAEFDSHPYLIFNYQISYSYSATLLKEMQAQKKRTGSGGFLAFAPSYSGDTLDLRSDPWRAVLGKLQYNEWEAQTIGKIMRGEAVIGAAATEDEFLERAAKANILHLALHAKANDLDGEFSYLAFFQKTDSLENELVFVKDLYTMRIRAALVVLSACETGIGELQRGEGVVSLARGFSYAGASSIVTTLWSIDDRSSAEIMVSFYQHLKKGLTKDAALRQSKLDFLADSKGRNTSHPLYWAAFVPVGSMETVSSGVDWWLVASVSMLILSAGLRIWQYFRRRNSAVVYGVSERQ